MTQITELTPCRVAEIVRAMRPEHARLILSCLIARHRAVLQEALSHLIRDKDWRLALPMMDALDLVPEELDLWRLMTDNDGIESLIAWSQTTDDCRCRQTMLWAATIAAVNGDFDAAERCIAAAEHRAQKPKEA